MKSNIGVIVGLVLAGALFIGCESAEAESKEESIAAIREIAGSKVTLTPIFKVRLSGTGVTDGGLAHLKGLTGMKMLFLGKTKVTDAGLVHLKGMTGLEGLLLQNTKVTDAGVKKLRAALPKCKIYH